MSLSDDLRDLIERETTQAQSVLRGLVTAMPTSVEARHLLAISHLRRLEFPAALTHFRETLTLDPRHDDSLRNVGFCLLAMGDYEGALAAFRQAFAVLQAASNLRFIALLCHRLGRIDEAIAAYGLLLENCPPASPRTPSALQGLAAALRDAGRTMEADQHILKLEANFSRQPLSTSSGLVARNSSDDFHEWSAYADKSRLASALSARGAVDPAGRFPESFVLPADKAALQAFAAGPDAPALYIVKPIRGSGGQGISVTADLSSALDRDDVVIQRYLDRPYLIEGRKGHCRIYGLVTSAEPVRAYVYSEGIVRIAPEPYDADPARAADPAIHVTNTALHLGHPGLSISQDPSQEDTGSIRSLSALLARMSADGFDSAVVFEEIKHLVAWFVRLLAAEGLFARQAASGPARAFAPKLFGLDVLIDDQGHPWLIEMQQAPAAHGAPLLDRINGEMFKTCFRMSHFPLIDDATPPELAALLLADDTARRHREAEIEAARRGQFVPLDL